MLLRLSLVKKNTTESLLITTTLYLHKKRKVFSSSGKWIAEDGEPHISSAPSPSCTMCYSYAELAEPGLEPGTFRSVVQSSTDWAIPGSIVVHISGAQVLMSTENVTMSTRFWVLVLIWVPNISQWRDSKLWGSRLTSQKEKHWDGGDADLLFFPFHPVRSLLLCCTQLPILYWILLFPKNHLNSEK